MISFITIFITLVGLVIFFEITRLIIRWRIAHHLSKHAQSFSREKNTLPKSILLVGDSTIFGVGASEPRYSLAGRIAEAFPYYNVWNRGVNALSLNDLPAIISHARSEKASFDCILIIIGGINILRLTPLPKIKKYLLESIAQAKILSPNIMIASSSNVRSAPFFRFPADRIFEQKHREVEKLYREVAMTEGITHISLFHEYADCPFGQEPKKLYAPDGLHPNDNGYALWFEKVRAAMKLYT